MTMAAKTYIDLKREVWDTGRCSGCGACIAVCPADSLTFDSGEMVVSPRSTGYCKQETDNVTCGACYEAAPVPVTSLLKQSGSTSNFLLPGLRLKFLTGKVEEQ